MPKKKKKWVKARHRVICKMAYCVIKPMTRIKYSAKIEKFAAEGNRQYLVLFNHQTAYDQFFVALSFKNPLYFIASEDLFSNGWISRLLEWAVAPIPIKKQATDPRAVLNCLRVQKEGGSIALSPEGNRTFSGKTEYIKDSIAPFVKALKMPLAFYKIEGGYGVHPRWSDVRRKGKMHCYVSRVLEPEEYLDMPNEELYALIQKELYVNEGTLGEVYRHKKLAEYLERVAYYCPDCGLSTFESKRDIITCKKCGKQIRYLPTKELQGVNCNFPYRFYNDWYEAQSAYMNGLDVLSLVETPLYTEEVKLFEVVLYQKKRTLIKRAKLSLFGDRVEIEGGKEKLVFPFAEISTATVLGRNKLNLYIGDKLYQVKGDARFNAVKYVQTCYRCKNQQKGEDNGKFLGL